MRFSGQGESLLLLLRMDWILEPARQHCRIVLLLGAFCCICCWAGQVKAAAGTETNRLEIRSVVVDGKPLPSRPNQRLVLPCLPRTVTFGFGAVTNVPRSRLRLRYKLDGFDEAWREVAGEMRLAVRFLDPQGDQISDVIFRVFGQTEGWSGSASTSAFVHRREIVPVPPNAQGFWVVMSSAGPPATIGMYVISNLVIRPRHDPRAAPVLDLAQAMAGTNAARPDATPVGWARDGLRPSMAHFLESGTPPKPTALALLDEDPTAHVEWRTSKETAPVVIPGDDLLIEWDEAYSLGLAQPAEIPYLDLPSGYYRFRINELTLQGTPTETETSLAFEIPLAFWRTPLVLGRRGDAGPGRHRRWLALRDMASDAPPTAAARTPARPGTRAPAYRAGHP